MTYSEIVGLHAHMQGWRKCMQEHEHHERYRKLACKDLNVQSNLRNGLNLCMAE